MSWDIDWPVSVKSSLLIFLFSMSLLWTLTLPRIVRSITSKYYRRRSITLKYFNTLYMSRSRERSNLFLPCFTILLWDLLIRYYYIYFLYSFARRPIWLCFSYQCFYEPLDLFLGHQYHLHIQGFYDSSRHSFLRDVLITSCAQAQHLSRQKVILLLISLR